MTFTELPESGSGSHMGAAPLLPSTLFASESKNEETETASGFSLVGVIVLVVLLLLLSAILVILFYRILQRHGRIRDERQHTAPAPSSSSAVIDPKRIKRRYETIEGWLITKKVQPHTVVCGKIKSLLSKEKDEENPFKEVTSQDTAETDTDDEYWSSEEDGFFGAGQEEEGKECPVCMDPLKVGDVVSWSPSQNCEHAFHHECIKEWLLQHTDCPFCRETFLLVDAEDVGKTRAELKKMSGIHAKRTATTYFCIRDGLVVVPDRVACTEAEMKTIKQRACPCVNRLELCKIRGDREEGTLRTSNRVVLPTTYAVEEENRSTTSGQV